MIPLKDVPFAGKPALGTLIFILLWVGIGLIITAMNLYDDVAMPLYIALLLWILPGIILTPLLFNYVPSQKLKGFSKALVLLAANIIASIIYKNQLKNFDFPSETMTILNHSKNIRLQTRPGFLGFEVIKSKQLVKQ